MKEARTLSGFFRPSVEFREHLQLPIDSPSEALSGHLT
jgi:hypothetical protein